ncbi:MAG: DUF2017 family protein [Actinobacteria bacterium]|nr:DUF2017 family protein [Actinomycetota bacterium]
MTGSGIRLELAGIEVSNLVQLIDQFLTLLQGAEIGEDPALARLTPAVYPDDAEASAEFAAATGEDLLDRRAADARVVRATLAGATDDASGPDRPVALVVAGSELDAWLRTLAALRLVIASRLGLDDSAEPDPADSRHGVYDWLGYRLDVLIEAADDLDDADGGHAAEDTTGGSAPA